MARFTIVRNMTGMARRLREDHHDFEQMFADLLARARGGDWRDLDALWSAFAQEMEDHFAFEEHVLFPAYGQQGEACYALVDRLVREHAEIRQTLDDIGMQIELHEVRASTVEAFIEQLRKHAAIENASIYPWVELEGRHWSGTTSARIAS